MGLTVDIEPWL